MKLMAHSPNTPNRTTIPTRLQYVAKERKSTEATIPEATTSLRNCTDSFFSETGVSPAISFGKSFRVGIDTSRPDKLVTDGIFAYSRNPIYVSGALILTGQFLIWSNWILLIYALAGFWLFHRQVLVKKDI